MRRLLIHPPFADPTQPYLSLPTLKGWLRARHLDAQVIDLSLEAAHHLFRRSSLEGLARRLGHRFLELNHSQVLDFDEQREYKMIAAAREGMEELLAAEIAPLQVFRNRELFFDPAAYSLARRRVEACFEALGATTFPYRFGFNRVAHSVLPWSLDLLADYRARSPLRSLYEEVFDASPSWESEAADPGEERPPTIDLEGVDFAGISVVFPSQIPEALHLCAFLRQRLPGAFIALGGPCIHQVTVHLDDEGRREILRHADGIGLFEGEETLSRLFPLLPSWRQAQGLPEKAEALREVPNLLIDDGSAARLGPQWMLDLREAPAPDYSDLDLDRYLAPSRTILYAPTRGCYWNKCSFCYYGLSETATAKYREIPPERAVADLARLSRRLGVRNVYLSCDVLSPSYAVRFAEALIERGLSLRWSSDLKIEKYFTPERCKLLRQSGLRAAAFGIESGSDRILQLMRKGADRKTMTDVNRAFHEAGIATEWMTFTDHPGETTGEALATVDWIGEEAERVDLFIVGEFGLESGSDIAAHPERYGIRKVFHALGDDLRLHALFEHEDGPRSAGDRDRVDEAVAALAADWALHPYPWAGANSTHHTFLCFLELGQRAFRTHFQRANAERLGALPTPPASHVPGLRERPRFSVDEITERERRFFEGYLRAALYTTIPARRTGGAPGDTGGREVALLSPEHFREATRRVEPLRAGAR